MLSAVDHRGKDLGSAKGRVETAGRSRSSLFSLAPLAKFSVVILLGGFRTLGSSQKMEGKKEEKC